MKNLIINLPQDKALELVRKNITTLKQYFEDGKNLEFQGEVNGSHFVVRENSARLLPAPNIIGETTKNKNNTEIKYKLEHHFISLSISSVIMSFLAIFGSLFIFPKFHELGIGILLLLFLALFTLTFYIFKKYESLGYEKKAEKILEKLFSEQGGEADPIIHGPFFNEPHKL